MFHHRNRIFSVTGLVLAGLVAGCAGASDEQTSETEQADRIDPKDDENLGLLLVEAPAALPALDYTYSVDYRNQAATVGDPLRITAGTGCIRVQSRFQQHPETCGIAIERRKTTKVGLAALLVNYDASEAGTLVRDFGPTPKLTITGPLGADGSPTAQTRPRSVLVNQAVLGMGQNVHYWRGDQSVPAVTLPGGYAFSLGLPILDDVKRDIAPGAIETVDLTPPERRVTIEVQAPVREFPNAPAAKCESERRQFLVWRETSDNFERGVINSGSAEPAAYDQKRPSDRMSRYSEARGIKAFHNFEISDSARKAGEVARYRAFPFTAEEKAQYEYVVNGLRQMITAKPGETQRVIVKRIDVNDVEVTRENGSTYMVKGTYQVFRENDEQNWLPLKHVASQYNDCSGDATTQASTFPTATGVDVLPGKYKIVISYRTEEGNRTQEHVVDLN